MRAADALRAVAGAVCVATATWAQGFAVSGTFSGTATAFELPLPVIPEHDAAFYEGARITGSFAVSVPNATFWFGDDRDATFLNGNGGTLSLHYEVRGLQFDFERRFDGTPLPGDDTSVLSLQEAGVAGGPQTASFMTQFMGKYSGAGFALQGFLFTAPDPATLAIDPDRLPSFTTGFIAQRDGLAIGVDVDRVRFALAAPVPEPSASWLAVIGVAGMAFMRRRRSG